MGHIFVLEEGRNLVNALLVACEQVLHLGESREVTREQPPERSGECEGLRRSLARSLAVNGELARGGYIAG